MRHGRYAQRVRSDEHLLRVVQRLLGELKERPLHNSSLDLDNPEIDGW